MGQRAHNYYYTPEWIERNEGTAHDVTRRGWPSEPQSETHGTPSPHHRTPQRLVSIFSELSHNGSSAARMRGDVWTIVGRSIIYINASLLLAQVLLACTVTSSGNVRCVLCQPGRHAERMPKDRKFRRKLCCGRRNACLHLRLESARKRTNSEEATTPETTSQQAD